MASSGATVERVARADPDITWDVATLTNPTWFYPKYGPLPGVVDVRGQVGDWSSVGKTRTLILSDGGSVIETLTDVQRGTLFAYDLSEFQGLFGALVSGARAEWDFWVDDAGTGIRWSYVFHPRRGAGLVVGLIVKLFWARYMKGVLPVIVREAEQQDSRA